MSPPSSLLYPGFVVVVVVDDNTFSPKHKLHLVFKALNPWATWSTFEPCSLPWLVALHTGTRPCIGPALAAACSVLVPSEDTHPSSSHRSIFPGLENFLLPGSLPGQF